MILYFFRVTNVYKSPQKAITQKQKMLLPIAFPHGRRNVKHVSLNQIYIIMMKIIIYFIHIYCILT